MRLLLAALLVATAVAQESSIPKIDPAALAPVLSQSWAAGESCTDDVTDFVIDTDGQPYSRISGGFTPLTTFELQGDTLTTTDEIGIGRTTSTYKLAADNSLRLWSEIYDPAFGEQAQEGEPTVQRVKDGLIIVDQEGEPMSEGALTVVMKPCPVRPVLFPADIIAALDGTWATANGKGGICAMGADSVTFQLTRPIPHVLRGAFGGEVTSTSYALGVTKDGESFVVTEGSAFEAGDYTFTPDADGGLTQANPYADGPLELHRCP